jgi:hypothetical protein
MYVCMCLCVRVADDGMHSKVIMAATAVLLVAALVAALVVAALAVRSLLRQQAFVRRVGLPHDPHLLPFLGNVFHWMVVGGGLRRAAQRSLEHTRMYGSVHVGFMFETPTVHLADARELRNVLAVDVDRYDRATMEQSAFDELLGDGLILLSNGDRWRTVPASVLVWGRRAAARLVNCGWV